MPKGHSLHYHKELILKVQLWEIIMTYKCAACFKAGVNCVKSSDLSLCFSCLKKTCPCDMTSYSEVKFFKFKREHARLQEEMKLAH